MDEIQVMGKRVSAAEVRRFFKDLLNEVPKEGTFISSLEMDDTMYMQQFVIDGFVFNVSITDTTQRAES